MDDLYDEVMSLLHETGAFAERLGHAGLSESAEKTRIEAMQEMARRRRVADSSHAPPRTG